MISCFNTARCAFDFCGLFLFRISAAEEFVDSLHDGQIGGLVMVLDSYIPKRVGLAYPKMGVYFVRFLCYNIIGQYTFWIYYMHKPQSCRYWHSF